MDGWQIILFYNNSMNFPFCHLRQSEFLFVDNLFQRFVAVRFRSYHTERRRLKSYSACSLDLGSFGLGCLQKDMENRMRKIITSLIAI